MIETNNEIINELTTIHEERKKEGCKTFSKKHLFFVKKILKEINPTKPCSIFFNSKDRSIEFEWMIKDKKQAQELKLIFFDNGSIDVLFSDKFAAEKDDQDNFLISKKFLTNAGKQINLFFENHLKRKAANE